MMINNGYITKARRSKKAEKILGDQKKLDKLTPKRIEELAIILEDKLCNSCEHLDTIETLKTLLLDVSRDTKNN